MTESEELLSQVNRASYIKRSSKEPAVAVGVGTGTVAGVLSLILLVAPDLLSEKQLNIVLVIGTFLIPIVTALFTRGKVWSFASVVKVVDQAGKEAKEEVINAKPRFLESPKDPFMPKSNNNDLKDL